MALKQTERPLLSNEEIVALVEQADALRQSRAHGREVFLRHPGDARSAHLGRGLDFEEVRAYQAGDDIRAMDWRTTARTGKPYLKIYREEHHPALHIVVDRGASMRFGTQRQLKVTQAARIAIAAAVLESSAHACIGVSLIDTGLQVLPCLNKQAGILQLAQVSAEACPPIFQDSRQAASTWLQGLRRMATTLPAGSRVLIVSDFHWLFPEAELLLAHLAEHHDVAAVKISDPAEYQLPVVGRMPFHDLSASKLRWLDTANRTVREQFAAAATQQQCECVNSLARLDIDCFAIATCDETMDLFLGRLDE